MSYKIKSCPICGAGELKKLNTEEHDGIIFNVYKCLACDASLSEYEKYQKILAKEQAKKVEEIQETADEPISEPVKEAVESTATEIYKNAIKNTVAIFASADGGSKVGTGMFVSSKGYFVTNAHIVMDFDEDRNVVGISDDIFGECGADGYKFDAEFVYANPENDLALLKIDLDEDVETVVLSNKETTPGEPVYAIGNNRGDGLCIVEGIVSDIHRKVGNVDYVLISAPVTHGSSGCPVFNKMGELIGVVKGSRTDERLMNYVIPVETVKAFLEEAKEKEEIDF